MKTAICNILLSVCLFSLTLLPLAADVMFDMLHLGAVFQEPYFFNP